jgi:hypothetical protein
MKTKTSTLVFLFMAAAAFAAAAIAYNFYPPVVQYDSPELASLNKKRRELSAYTESRLKSTNESLAAMQREVWTAETLQFFMKSNVREGWVAQNLGEGSTRHFKTLRYAFQRPGATAQHYAEFAALIRALESARCVSIQMINVNTHPGYQGSRRFNQLSVIATFYFQSALRTEVRNDH